MPAPQLPGHLPQKQRQTHQDWMSLALGEAQAAGLAGEVPVGAVVVDPSGHWVTSSQNRRERDQDPTAHAEVLALRQAGQILGDWQLKGCRLYVTLEPCPMCAAAITQARLGSVIYGAEDPKAGALGSVLNLLDSPATFHRPQVIGGICERDCRVLLHQWFRELRELDGAGDP